MITNPHPIAHIKAAFIYNPHTGKLFWKRKGAHNGERGREAGYHHQHGYVAVAYQGKSYMAHHLAWAMLYHCWPVGMVDHVNGDRTDNRAVNLTLANKENWSKSTKTLRPPWE